MNAAGNMFPWRMVCDGRWFENFFVHSVNQMIFAALLQIVNIRAAQLVAVCIDWTSTKGLNFFALMVLSLTTKLVLGVRVNYMLIVIF